MSTNRPDISFALDVINNASDEQLLPYHWKVGEVLFKLESVFSVRRTVSPASSNNIHRTKSQTANGKVHTPLLQDEEFSETPGNDNDSNVDAQSVALRPSLSVRTPVEEESIPDSRAGLLLKALKNQLDKIATYLAKQPPDAVSGELTWQNEDPRVNDLLVLQGDPRPSSQVSLRRVLSQRSLAIEFLQWEIENHKTSRLQELVNSLDSSAPRGHLTAYVNTRSKFIRKEAAHQGIRHGIKLLVIEELVGVSGVSALLGFVARKCWSIPYPEVRELVELLHKPFFKQLQDLAQKKTSWLFDCQSYYDKGSHNLHNVSPELPRGPSLDMPQQDIYGYLEQPVLQDCTMFNVQENIPQQDIYGYLEQPIPQDCSTFDIQENVPQQDVYGYLEQPVLQDCTMFNVHENMPQQEIYGYLEQPIPQDCGMFNVHENVPQQDIYGYLNQPCPQASDYNAFTVHSSVSRSNDLGPLIQTPSCTQSMSRSSSPQFGRDKSHQDNRITIPQSNMRGYSGNLPFHPPGHDIWFNQMQELGCGHRRHTNMPRNCFSRHSSNYGHMALVA